MEGRTTEVTEIENAIFRSAIGYEYEESEIKGNRTGNTTEVKKVRKQKHPDIRAAMVYLNLFCKE